MGLDISLTSRASAGCPPPAPEVGADRSSASRRLGVASAVSQLLQRRGLDELIDLPALMKALAPSGSWDVLFGLRRARITRDVAQRVNL
jgi:hypothetical protein